MSAFHGLRFRAAPAAMTFFASPKKVTKERRPHEAGLRLPLRCGRQRAGRETRSLRSLRQAGPAQAPLPPAPPRRLRAEHLRRVCQRLPNGDGGCPLGDAAQRGAARGCCRPALSERPQGASFAHGPLTPCSAREPAGRTLAGAPFFGYFLWQAKKVTAARPCSATGKAESAVAQRSSVSPDAPSHLFSSDRTDSHTTPCGRMLCSSAARGFPCRLLPCPWNACSA